MAAMIGIAAGWAHGADLECFTHAQWIDDAGNDGDSFMVKLNDQKKARVRLYFVDCPETGASWESDVRRVREQCRYFGLSDEKEVIELGKRAAAFTRERLAKPFTLCTVFASALGRSAEGRIYGFVKTADGKDLATLLVQSGMARTYGVGRENEAGVRRDEIKAGLSDMEAVAMLKNVGIWKYTDPDLLATLRATQRQEDTEIGVLRSDLTGEPNTLDKPSGIVDLNTASNKELQTLPGIGPALADRIMQGRPFKNIDDLQNVKGITKERLDALRSLIRLD